MVDARPSYVCDIYWYTYYADSSQGFNIVEPTTLAEFLPSRLLGKYLLLRVPQRLPLPRHISCFDFSPRRYKSNETVRVRATPRAIKNAVLPPRRS